MSVVLKIDSKELIGFTNKLEKMRKFDLPLAVRGTLNKAAFNLKKVTMPVSSDKHFTHRQANFFRANSRVEVAHGFSIPQMKSTVGFTTMKADKNYKSVLELEEQEYGGNIDDRSFVPMKTARVGDSPNAMVQAKNRIKRIDLKAVKYAKNFQGSRKQKFLRAALEAKKGGYVVSGLNKLALRRINSIKYEKGKGTVVNSTPLYSYKEGHRAKIKPTMFMREASMKSAMRLNAFYKQEFNRRIQRMR